MSTRVVGVAVALLSAGCGAEAPSPDLADQRVRLAWNLADASAGATLDVPLELVERTSTAAGDSNAPGTPVHTVRFVLATPLELSPYETLVLEVDADTGSAPPTIVAFHDSGGQRYRWAYTSDAWTTDRKQVRLTLPREARARIERLSIAFKSGADLSVDLQSLRFERDSGAAALYDAGDGDRRRAGFLGPERALAARARRPRGAGPCELSFAFRWVGPDAPTAAVALDVELATPRGTVERSWAPVADAWSFVRLDCPAEVGDEVRVQFRARAPALARFAVSQPTLSIVRDDAPTVLLITSDTHRGDHLGTALRPADVRTPHLDALAARGVRFVDCFASTNITVPSHVGLFTGLTPHATGVQDNQSSVGSAAWTLAEAFAAAGWATAAVTSINLLQPEHSGLGQGFERYAAPDENWSALQAVTRLERWWPDFAGRPLFVWLHVFDAHGPYQPAPEFVRWPAAGGPDTAALPAGARIPDWAGDRRDLESIRALYRGEVAGVDAALGSVLDAPRVRNGIVAFTADHGESLGQHGIWWAHKGVYKDTLHVPLLLAGPRALAGRASASPARQIDVGRTLLELAGVEPGSFGGRNLLASLDANAPSAPRFALGGGASAAAVTDAGWHLVGRLDEQGRVGRIELYDLNTDPSGETDVAAAEPARVANMQAALVAWLAAEHDAALLGGRKTDAETLRRLAELGYLGEDE